MIDKIKLDISGKMLFVSPKEIERFEADGNYTHIFFENGDSCISSKNLGFYEDLLSQRGFIRVHNSYMINVMKIKEITKGKIASALMASGLRIPIGSRKKKGVLVMLNKLFEVK